MRNKSVFFGLSSGIFWGLGVAISSVIFLKFDISPFLVALIHDFFSIFVLFIILKMQGKKIRLSIFSSLKSWAVVLAAVLAGPIGMQSSLYAVKYMGGAMTSAVTAIYPVISLLLAFVFLKQKSSKNIFIGIMFIVVGIFLESYGAGNITSLYLGLLFAFVCAFAWGSESVLGSYAMSGDLSEIEALLIRQITSFLAYLIIFVFVRVEWINKAQDINILLLIVAMVLSNMVSYILYYKAINNLQAAKATGLNVTYVVWTIVFMYLFTGSVISIKALVTSLLIVVGVYIIIKE